jgi:polyhydroxybutyrate depolymerase
MRRLFAALLLTLSVALVGCSAAAPEFPEGSSTHALRAGGTDRTYIVSVPADLPKNAPLVVVLHGGFGSAIQAQKAYGWDALAAEEGFVVAYPDGLGKAWNAGAGCCGRSGERDVDDVAFIESVVREISAERSIDASRVFVTGMSNGGMMAYRLACDTDTFAAIAPVSGTLLGACVAPSPTSVLHIHGTADESVHLDGSPGTGAENIDGMAIDELQKLWLEADECPAPSVTVEPPVTTSTATCGDDTVTLITVDGAGHQWPGSEQSKAQARLGTDEPSDALDATTVIWEFFASVG